MTKKPSATRIALFATRFNLLMALACIPGLPFLLDYYASLWPLPYYSYNAIMIAFYCCAGFVLAALWSLDKVLRNILAEEIFVPSNVRCIRRVQICCGIISLICTPAAVLYAPLWFIVVIMAFLFIVVWVVTQAMDAAVTIREENDLTI